MLTILLSAVLPWLIVAGGCWIGILLIRQSGRILLRLESVEAQIASLRAPAPAAAGQQSSGQPALPLGSIAPEFELPSLTGERVSLTRYRGRRILLTFFSANCGFCVQMAPDLAALSLDDPLPVLISAGGAEANRRLIEEYDIRCPVLLQPQNEVGDRYHVTGTPMGYLIDAEGKIASALAVGAEAVFALAREGGASGSGHNERRPLKGMRPLSASRILRSGLPVGTPAPDFTLPRLEGGVLSLADYREHRLLLVLSDPNCGPCVTLAAQLEAKHRAHPELPVMLVSRGSAEDNQRKAAELGLSVPIALQQQWEISRAYGMFQTPAAFLIDERGYVAADVATGPEAILALFERALRSEPPRTNEEVMHATT
jgi:peroxiredoxin